MFVVLEALHNGDLSTESVPMMLDCKADNLIHSKLDVIRFHVDFGLADMIRWTSETAERLPISIARCKARGQNTNLINASLSGVVVQIRCVFRRRTLLIRANVAGIWSDHVHCMSFLGAARLLTAFPPRPLRDFGGATAGASSPSFRDFTFSAALTNHCSKKA